MLIKIALGLEADVTGHARVGPLVGVRPQVVLQHARLGAAAATVRADVFARLERVLASTAARRLVVGHWSGDCLDHLAVS